MATPKEKSLGALLAADFGTDAMVKKPVEKSPHSEDAPLNEDERRSKVWNLYVSGVSNRLIATTLHMTEKQVQEDLDFTFESYRQALATKPGVQLIAEHLKMLDEIEAMARQGALQETTKKEFDKKTGRVETIQDNGEKARLLTVALKARQEKINLMFRAGLIAEEPQKLFHTLQGSIETKTTSDDVTRPREQIAKDVAELLAKGVVLRG